MDDFRAVFVDERVDLAFFAAAFVQVLAEEKASGCCDQSHRQSHQKVLYDVPQKHTNRMSEAMKASIAQLVLSGYKSHEMILKEIKTNKHVT